MSEFSLPNTLQHFFFIFLVFSCSFYVFVTLIHVRLCILSHSHSLTLTHPTCRLFFCVRINNFISPEEAKMEKANVLLSLFISLLTQFEPMYVKMLGKVRSTENVQVQLLFYLCLTAYAYALYSKNIFYF